MLGVRLVRKWSRKQSSGQALLRRSHCEWPSQTRSGSELTAGLVMLLFASLARLVRRFGIGTMGRMTIWTWFVARGASISIPLTSSA
jgi:hypothetical protein